MGQRSSSDGSIRRVAATLIAAALGVALLLATGVDQGWIHPNDPTLEDYPIQGLDVSHHQGPIDWEAVARAERFRFVWIKATEGGDWTDPRFAENWQQARSAGLIVGAYHYFTLCTPGRVQAEHFLATVPQEDRTLLPAVDLEHVGNCRRGRPGPEGARAEIRDFLQTVAQRTGREPVIYTTSAFHREYLRGALGEHPVWMRGVLVRPGPVDGRPWDFWQYLSRGRVPGIDGFVDQNVFRGGEDRFAEFVTAL